MPKEDSVAGPKLSNTCIQPRRLQTRINAPQPLPGGLFTAAPSAPLVAMLFVEVWGLEPQTYGLQSHRSSHLSYTPVRILRKGPSFVTHGDAGIQHHAARNVMQSKREKRAKSRTGFPSNTRYRASFPKETEAANICADIANDAAILLKGGDPAAPSGTATLLRLHPPYRAYLRHRPPQGLGERLRVPPTRVV